MTRTRRVSTTSALIVCLIGSHLSGTLFAEETSSKEALASSSAVMMSSATPAATSTLDGVSIELQPATATDLSSAPPFTLGGSRFTLSGAGLATHGPLADAPQMWRSAFNAMPVETTSLAQRRGYWGRRSRGRNGGAAAAVILGAASAIAGTAVLVYANRPECTTNQMASGCGYGTKVIGGSVLAGGVVGLVVGAATWR